MSETRVVVQFDGCPEVLVSKGENGLVQFSLPDANGDALPFAELQPHGTGHQIQRLGHPTGAVAVDGNGKVLVSGMVDE